MPPYYTVDQNLANLAETAINNYYPGLKYLKISYMFREIVKYANNQAVAVKATKCDTRNFILHQTHFIIEVDRLVWNEASQKYREAIIDRALCSIHVELGANGQPILDKYEFIKCSVKHPGSAEFPEVLSRHGAYSAELREFESGFQRSSKKPKISNKKALSESTMIDLSTDIEDTDDDDEEMDNLVLHSSSLTEEGEEFTELADMTDSEEAENTSEVLDFDENGDPILDSDFSTFSSSTVETELEKDPYEDFEPGKY